MGIAPYGIGTPAATAPLGGAPLTDAQGVRQNARKIDLATRQYTYDATGRAVGVSAIYQQVQLVATTALASSAVLALGNEIASVKDVTNNVQQRIRSIWTSAYARLVDRGLITLNDVVVEILPATAERGARALTRIKFTDLTTGKDHEITT